MNAHFLRSVEHAANHPDWADRLGWMLVHSLWQFALVAFVLGVALRFMTRNSSTARYAASLFALASMVLLPLATWWALPQSTAIKPPPQPLVSVTTDRAQPMKRPIVEPPASGDVTALTKRDLPTIDSPPVEWAEPIAPPTPTAPLEQLDWRQRLESWLPTIVWGWLAGVLLFAVRPVWSAWTVRQLRRTGTAPVSAEIESIFKMTTAKLGLRREVRLLQSAVMQVPAVIGYLRPVVLVPISVASGFPPEQLEALFAHELAHIRRHDYLVNLLQTAVETLFFYHPAIWWVSSQIRCERENCCDDVALRVVPRQTDYVKSLVALEALRSRPPLMTVAASGGPLLARIRRIVGADQEPKPGFAALLCAVLVLVALAVGNMAAETSEVPPAAKPPAPAPAKDFLTTAELNQSPFHVALPDGSVIALLGLGTSPADGNHWWSPDGSTLAKVPPKRVAEEAWGLPRGGQTIRGIALDAMTQHGGTFQASVSGTTWYATPSRDKTSDGDYERHRFVMAVSAKSSTSIFVKYFAKEWRTVGATRASSSSFEQIAFPEGSAVFASPSEKDGAARSIVMYDVKDRDVRVVAVDGQNVEYPPTITTGDGRSRLVESQYQGLPLRRVMQFRFQIRHSLQIEFRNVSLQPGQKTNVEVYIDGKRSVPPAADTRINPTAVRTSTAQQPKSASATGSEFLIPLPDGGELEFLGVCQYPCRGHAWWRPDGSPLAQTPDKLPPDTGNGWFPHSILREFAFNTATPAGQGAVHVGGLRDRSFSEFVSLEDVAGTELRKHRLIATFPENSVVGTFAFNFFRGTWIPFRPRGGKDDVTLKARVEFEPAPSAELATERTRARLRPKQEKQNGRWSWHVDEIASSPGEAIDVRIAGTLLPSDYQFRLVAVDRDNHEHPTVLYTVFSEFPASICGPALPLSSKNRPVRAVCWDLPRDKVKEFRFLTRPLNFHNVEFRNLSLLADRKTNVEVFIDGKRFMPEAVSSNDRANSPAAHPEAQPLETVTAVVAPSPVSVTPAVRPIVDNRVEIPVLVTDGTGHPVAGATVGRCIDFRCYERTKTDAAGRAVFKVGPQPEFQYVFAVKPEVGVDYVAYHDPGRSRPDLQTPSAAGLEPIKLVLQGTRTVRMRLKEVNGQIMTSTRVSPASFQLPGKWTLFPVSEIEEFIATTDREGVATFRNLPANNQGKIRFSLVQGLFVIPDEFAFDPAAPVEEIDVVVHSLAPTLHGSVSYPDGKLAPQATVAIVSHMTDDNLSRWSSPQNQKVCNSEGHFAQTVDPDTSYEFSASIGPFVSPWQTYVWQAGTPNAPLKLELQQGVRVHGRWLRRGDQGPVAGVNLTLHEGGNVDDFRLALKTQFPRPVRKSLTDLPWPKHSRRVKTDDEGRFEFSVLPGTYHIEAGLARAVGRDNAAFTITNQSEFEINFQSDLPDFRAFVGSVVLKSNPKQHVPLGLVEGVSTDAAHTGDDFRAECDAEGEFHMRRAPRDMLVYAASPDRSLSGIDRISADANDVILSVGPTASVHGRLIDRAGRPLANRVIEAGIPVKLATLSNLEFGSRTTTNRRGEFTIANLTPGWHWELAAAVTVDVGDRGVESREVIGSLTPPSAIRVELGDLTLSTTESAGSQPEPGLTRKALFHPEADAEADIAAALATAKREHKRALLVRVTNANSRCYRLAEILAKNEEIAAILNKGFVLLLVDADANVKLFEDYIRPSWRPFVPILTVLDSDGKRLINQSTDGWGFWGPPLNPDVAKLQAFLLQWSPSL